MKETEDEETKHTEEIEQEEERPKKRGRKKAASRRKRTKVMEDEEKENEENPDEMEIEEEAEKKESENEKECEPEKEDGGETMEIEKTDHDVDNPEGSETRGNEEENKDKTEQEEEEKRRQKNEKERVLENIVQKHLLLYFALCTKQPSLLRQLVEVYTQVPNHVKKEILKQSRVLIRTLGPSDAHLLKLISEFPKGADTFVLQALHSLTDGAVPPPILVETAKSVYKQTHDARFLVPILSGLSKEDVTEVVGAVVMLPSKILKNAIYRLLSTPALLTPEELLVTLHTVQLRESKDPKSFLRKLIEAINYCFEQKSSVTQSRMAIVLQQLVDVAPIPPLLMRTVIQTIEQFPKLTGFTMGILSRLISKQVWASTQLWQGFVKCCKVTQPHSFPVLLQLPPTQLEDVLKRVPSLKTPLVEYCKQNPSTIVPRVIQSLLRLEQ